MCERRTATGQPEPARGSLIPCADCDGKGEVPVTPGQPGDGSMECPTCGESTVCGDCADEERERDLERAEQLAEEDRFLYGI